jgi:RNA polymerase sigma-70 factor (ECF subfamily)
MQDVEYLFYTYRDDVFRLAVSYTRSIQEAEDVCQSVFLKLMEQKDLRPGSEKAWLLQVTANQCRSLLRSGWWKKTAPLEDTLPAAPFQTNDILQKVLQLPPKYRVVVYLHYYEGRSTQEIGKLLKISRSAVTTRLSRAREILKNQLMEV